LSLELVDKAHPDVVLARDWYNISTANAAGNVTGNSPRVVDQGSNSVYEPFLEYTFTKAASYQIRVSSVQIIDIFSFISFFFPETIQLPLGGVSPGLKYDLVISLPRHPSNPQEIDLKDKILTIVDGTGVGQVAKITAYNAE